MKRNKNYILLIILCVIMFISMSTSIIINIISINKIAIENNNSQSIIITSMIGNGIEKTLLRPITVSETMSQDYSLKQMLKTSGADAENQEKNISNYLKAIKDGFDYQMVFALSNISKAYYTYDGISKYINPDVDEHDIWYKSFLETNERYVLNVDTDENNQWRLSIFVDIKILDDDGSLLGVTGVGVEMVELQHLLAEYENLYNVKISLVNKDGLVQVNCDEDKIELEMIDNRYFDKVSENSYYYERIGFGSRTTHYMENLNWYLVVTDSNLDNIGVERFVTPSVLIFIIGIIFMITAVYVISRHQYSLSKELYKKTRQSLMDDMTKVYNRRSFDEECAKLSLSSHLHEYTLIEIDINGLKTANDTLGHDAGDELIKGTANCLKESLGSFGKIYRTGGDEFFAIIKLETFDIETILKNLDYLVSKWRGKYIKNLTIAKGVVKAEDYPDASLEELLKMADKAMYEDKNQYYIRTGINRRKEV